MLANVMGAIGLVGDVLGIVGFAMDNMAPSSPNGATMRIKAGLNDHEEEQKGGRINRIHAYDSVNRRIGEVKNVDVSSGDFADLTFDQKVGGVQTQYASIIGSNGAICISWITLQNKDGAADAAWTGDVGFGCGHRWHWGLQMAGWIEVPNQPAQPYVPRCTWLDGDHTNGIDTSAIKIDFFAYSQTLSETVNSNAACSKTMFSGNTDDIDGVPMPMPKLDHLAPFSNTLVGLQQKKKRSMKGVQRREWMEKRLVVSDFPQQNATELCLDDLSYGPDAVGSDGYYCDMSTRELSPLCSFQDVEGCVNVDAQKNKITKRSSVAKRSVHLVHRSYDKMHMLNFN